MNQEQNNLNINNNTLDSNKIPSYTSINNENINSNVNMNQQFQSTQQNINGFENRNRNLKKNKAPIFMIIIILAIVVGLIIFMISKTSPSNKENQDSEVTNNNESKKDDNTNKDEMVTAANYFDTSKFDASKFKGKLYDEKGEYLVSDLILSEKYSYHNYINIRSNSTTFYFFTNDFRSERSLWTNLGKCMSDEYIKKLIEIVGHPSTYCERYYEHSENNSTKGYSGEIALYYNYKDYVLEFIGHDFRGWQGYNFSSPSIDSAYIMKKEDLNKTKLSTYKCFGDMSIFK